MDRVKVCYAEMLAGVKMDGSPFDEYPDWLGRACRDLRVKLSSSGARDYAVVDVDTPRGWREATPGDYITHDNGVLGVEVSER